MAWYSPNGDQNLAWHGVYHDPRSQFPVAARQSPCDPEYGYSRPLYTNYGGYSTPANPTVAQPSQGREPEWLQESRRQDEAWEQRHDVRPVSQVCIHNRGNATGTPQALPARTTATWITAATAKGASNHAGIDAGEEAARQITPAATPPPARPARSAARTPPPPIPPRSTRPRIDTRNDDARVKVHARDTTWQEPPPARPPPPPARPPPRPARAAARRPKNPAHIEHPPAAPLYAKSARATSPGDADRTAPTNDRPSSSSTSTATAPPTRPVPSAATPTHSQSAPLSPRRLCGLRTPRNASDHRLTRTIDSDDVLQDVDYLRAIAAYAGEGGDGREAHREHREDTLARSVRGTSDTQPQITNRDFSCDRTYSRAGRTSTLDIAAPAVVIEDGRRSGRERAAPVPARPPRPIDARREGRNGTPCAAYANGSRRTTPSERGVAHATSIAISPSTPLAPPLSSRSSPARTQPASSDVRAHPPRLTQLSARNTGSATTIAQGHQDAAWKAVSRADEETREEYTSADSVRLARALAVFGPARVVAEDREQEGGEGLYRARASLQPAARERSRKHPPPPRPPPIATLTWTTATRGRAIPEDARVLATKHPPDRRYSSAPRPPSLSPPPVPSSRATTYGYPLECLPPWPPLSQAFIHATTHFPMPSIPLPQHAPSVPPLLPPHPRGLQPPPPPPPDWPFPLSVEEMGWILTAVAMAQRMAREEEQDRAHEYGDNDPFDLNDIDRDEDPLTREVDYLNSDSGHTEGSAYDDREEHASDTDMTFHIESPLWPPHNDSASSSAFDFATTTTRDWYRDEGESTDSFDNPANPVSPPASFADIEHSDADSQDWGETSAPYESGDDFADYRGSEEE